MYQIRNVAFHAVFLIGDDVLYGVVEGGAEETAQVAVDFGCGGGVSVWGGGG